MNRSTLVLVRHAHVGDNDYVDGARLCGWFDPPLSRRGWAQVHSLCARLERAPAPTALYTSPLCRALSMARVIGSRVGLVPRPLGLVREIHCGRLEGMLLRDVQGRYPFHWATNLRQADDGFHWPGGESYRDFRRRVLSAVDFIAARHPGQRVIVVTHAGVIGQIVGALNGTRAACWEAFRPDNASLSVVEWADGTGKVRTFDDHDHLGHDVLGPQHVGSLDRVEMVTRCA
jgi:broad specificity phosphatase PhoE